MLNMLKYLPLAAVTAFAVPATAQSDQEIYEGGVNCGALHSFMSGALEGEDDAAAEQFFGSATRFYLLALTRNEENAEKDMNTIIDTLIARIEGIEDEAEIEEFLTAGIERCEAFRESVAEEYDSFEIEEEVEEEAEAEG